MVETLQKRLKERMDAKSMNAFATAKAAGLGESFVRDILRGRSRSPSADNLAKLAAALETTPDDLLGRLSAPGDNELRRIAAPVQEVPVLGRVSASHWWSVDDDFHDPIAEDGYTVPSVSGYPVSWQFGMIVEGNCLNKIAAHGDRLICLDIVKSEYSIVEGDLVVIERLRFDGQMMQRTAKRVKKSLLGFELWPESDDPAHQEPIRWDHPPEGEEIRLWAKVLFILKKP